MDNVLITQGSGTSVATDDVESVHYQKVKLDMGGDGVSVPLVGTADGLPVVVADGKDVTQGDVDDAAVITNTTGTVSGKLRGLIKLMIDLIAKIPALGTAGTASTDVITVQGIAAGTVLPISGSVTISDGSGPVTVDSVDGGHVTIGTTTDIAAVGNGTLIGLLKQLRVLLAGGLPAAVGGNGGIKVEGIETSSAATVNSVASSATSVTLFAANAACKGRIVTNDSTQILFLKFGATASSSSYTVPIGPNEIYEFPKPVYTAIVDGIWVSANGFARVTETT